MGRGKTDHQKVSGKEESRDRGMEKKEESRDTEKGEGREK